MWIFFKNFKNVYYIFFSCKKLAASEKVLVCEQFHRSHLLLTFDRNHTSIYTQLTELQNINFFMVNIALCLQFRIEFSGEIF